MFYPKGINGFMLNLPGNNRFPILIPLHKTSDECVGS